jgi:hypothetical protein
VIGSTNSGTSNSKETGGLSAGAIGGIVSGLVGFFLLVGVIVVFFLMKRAERNGTLDSDKIGLIGKKKISTPVRRMVTGAPNLGETEKGGKPKSKNGKVGGGGRIYWNNYI